MVLIEPSPDAIRGDRIDLPCEPKGEIESISPDPTGGDQIDLPPESGGGDQIDLRGELKSISPPEIESVSQSPIYHSPNTNTDAPPRLASGAPPMQENEPTHDPAPLALIPEEHIQVAPDPVDAIIERTNALAASVDASPTRGKVSCARISTRRSPPRVPESGGRPRGDLRVAIADRIDEHGVDGVIATLEAYAAVLRREPEQRGWWGRDMFTRTRWAVVLSIAANGTAKRFRNEREREEYVMRHAGAHETPTYAPSRTINADEFVSPDWDDLYK
jgi:hypothetical protein